MLSYQERLLKVIPGGAHTYSRGYDQYPCNAPEILLGGKGAYVFTPENKKFLDYGMGLRAVNIGYAENEIDQAAIKQINLGNNLTRPSLVELEAAELMVELIESVDMVKFTKNGSSAVTAAVKLARAYTGREMVLRCAEQPFFSYDDWFIGSTPITRGITKATMETTKSFHYNDLDSVREAIKEFHGKIACIILEPATTVEPNKDYLIGVQDICKKEGIVFILDEMITGFRWHSKGAQYLYGVKPDLCTFGKAMANGFSLACVAGRREIMQLGSIEFEGHERVFLLSSTHGAEMSSLGAFIETMNFMKTHKVIDHLWTYGGRLIEMVNAKATKLGIQDFFSMGGIPCSPFYLTLDQNKKISLEFRTLFMQEMIKHGVLMPWVAIAYRHGDEEFLMTEFAVDKALTQYKKALEDGIESYLVGPAVKPVFRKFN